MNASGLKRMRYTFRAVGRQDGIRLGKLKEPGYGARRRDDTVRAVCSGCNSGWMHRLEELAKPILLRQMEDRRDRLT